MCAYYAWESGNSPWYPKQLEQFSFICDQLPQYRVTCLATLQLWAGRKGKRRGIWAGCRVSPDTDHDCTDSTNIIAKRGQGI